MAGDRRPADRGAGRRISGDLLVARSGRQRNHVADSAGVDLHYRRHRSSPQRGAANPAAHPGTDARCWQTTLPASWRGSYCFYSLRTRRRFFSPQLFNGEAPDRALLREGWRKLLPRAVADPRNPQSWKGGRGHAVSALELPQAPEQPGWHYREPVFASAALY